MRNSGSVEMAEFHAKGVTSPELDPPRVLSAKRSAERNRKKFPRKTFYLEREITFQFFFLLKVKLYRFFIFDFSVLCHSLLHR